MFNICVIIIKISVKMNTNQSIVAKAIMGESNAKGEFKPFKVFYRETKIGQKRFGQLYRGEKSPNYAEIEAISVCLNIPKERFGLISQ